MPNNERNHIDAEEYLLQKEILRAQLRSILSSQLWNLFSPLWKTYTYITTRRLKRTRIFFIPRRHLVPDGNNLENIWKITGEDPQFLLYPEFKKVMRHAGWVKLSIALDRTAINSAQVFIDAGDGFLSDLRFDLELPKDGHLNCYTYLPSNTRSIRLDPLTEKPRTKTPSGTIERITVSQVPEYWRKHPVNKSLTHLENFRFQLHPIQQLTRDLSHDYHWTSHGDDPYFQVNLDGSPLTLNAGFYILTYRIDSDIREHATKIYIDDGGDFSEANALSFRASSGKETLTILWAKKHIRRIRLDPMECQGQFTISQLKFHPTSHEIAIQKMLAAIPRKPQGIGANIPKLPDDQIYLTYKEALNINNQVISYHDWIELKEKPSIIAKSAMKRNISEWKSQPKISIVIPVYNTQENLLRECIDSVIHQTYENWELCIADDHSSSTHIPTLLNEYAQRDDRIKVFHRSENGGISLASNSALSIATGEYIALVDHDDVIPSYALYYVAEAINRNSPAKIIYSDEDKLSPMGERVDPHFKSDWNPELFLCQNYVSHLGIYRRDLLQKIGGFRPGVDGSQDYDLLLRCLAYVNEKEIIHIPIVLYHWRMVVGSTALSSDEKSYTSLAGIKALEDHINSEPSLSATPSRSITVDPGVVPNTYRINWPMPKRPPLVSLIIPTRDKMEVIDVAINSIIEKTTYRDLEIIIVDNNSVEAEALDWLSSIENKDSRIRVIKYNSPFNYSAINNYAVKLANGSLICLVNNDVEVINKDWLSEMVSLAVRRDTGCVGAKLYYGNNTIQHGGVILGVGGVANHSHKHFPRNHAGYFGRLQCRQNLSAVTAACLLVRREIYEMVGGLDEVNLTIAFNDVDFCLKVQEAGYRNIWTPYAELYHHESISRGREDTPEKINRFAKEVAFMEEKWGEKLKADPFYNPNLTLDREDFSLRMD